MKALLHWLDERTGWHGWVRDVVFAPVPGGARWRQVWGGTLLFAIAVQFFTGVCLWAHYSASAQTAWESVYYLQFEMPGGWLLRSLHHAFAQVVPVLLVLHLMQVIISGAYRAPREVNFWCGLLLLQLVVGLSITGWLLPWDQKGFWASRVPLNIIGIIPFIGHDLQTLMIGGAAFGHHTLTRFLALHAGLLPASLIAVLLVRAALFRRHGWAARESVSARDAGTPYWPDQALRDGVASLVVMVVVLYFVLRPWWTGDPNGPGPELRAPADPSEPYSAARPEWFFLFLFQFLKYFPAGREIWGAIIIPSFVLGVLFAMPIVGQWRLGRRFNLAFLAVLVAGGLLLTVLALREDAHNPAYQRAVTGADLEARRARVLAGAPAGIPVTGAVTLMRQDPLIQGPKLFAKHCASCHRFDGHDGTGRPVPEPQSAPDLAGFGSRPWLAGLLDPARVATTNYLGGFKARTGKMVKFVQKDVPAYTPEQKADLRRVIAALSAEASLRNQADVDRREAADLKAGAALIRDGLRCTECHQFHRPDEDATAPDLTGYASRAWLEKFLRNPAHPQLYGKKNDRMPAYGDQGILTSAEIGLLTDWLRGEWYESARASVP